MDRLTARRPSWRRRAVALTLAAAALAGCGDDQAEPADPPSPAGGGAPGDFRGRIYERNLVFTTLSGDSAFLVPWLMSAETLPGSVHRRARGLLARGGSWDAFFDETFETPPTRTPWRILPRGALRLLVGEGDAVESLVYAEAQRQLEVELTGAPLIEWTGPRGQTFRVLEGAIYVQDQRVAGLVLDMARVHEADVHAQGDWAFLTSGDSLQVILESPSAAPPGTPAGYRAWARLDFRDLQWPAVTVDWAEVAAFQPARQDIPTSWTLASGGNDLTGVLQVQSAHVQPGTGEGPILPVDALFLVSGTLRLEERSYPVRGLFRHTRP